MEWGYARVSTTEQSLAGQVEMLERAGVDKKRILLEYASGAAKRPVLTDLVTSRLRSGDVLVVASLDRLGRSSKDAAELLEIFKTEGITLRSLREGIDSAGPLGSVVAQILVAVAQWEREMMRERIHTGIARARARGEHLGRPYRLSPVEERTAVAWRAQGWTIAKIAKALHCSEKTVYRTLNRMRGGVGRC